MNLQEKSEWVRNEILKIHKIAPETRIASSLSCIEIFVSLYYSGIFKFNSYNWKDTLIISKGHGAIPLYPILVDLGFFHERELTKVCMDKSTLNAIPDSNIPGVGTTYGSLGQGLGVACGVSIALKRLNHRFSTVVLMGDGELNEGSVWEAIMFAGEHKLNNLILIIDNNKISMLDYCKNIIDLEPLHKKFEAFNWDVYHVDGHSEFQICNTLNDIVKFNISNQPKVLIANTIKGHNTSLENDSLCHIKNLSNKEINKLLKVST